MRRAILILLCAAGLLAAPPVTVTLLATTDLHGNLVPVDYVTGQPVARGLAKIATLIRQARGGRPGALLIDCGDTYRARRWKACTNRWCARAPTRWGTGPPRSCRSEEHTAETQ